MRGVLDDRVGRFDAQTALCVIVHWFPIRRQDEPPVPYLLRFSFKLRAPNAEG
jgi:hypothetical protein